MSDDNGVAVGPRTVLSVSLRARLRRSADELWVGLGDDFFVLSGPAIRMWELIDGSATLTDIAAVVAREYDADEPMVLDDAVETFVPLVAGHVLHARP
jgi:hypothetical protein